MLRADAGLRWRPPRQVMKKPDPALRDWLLDNGSLTRQLQYLSDGDFKVQVLAEGWQRCAALPLVSCFPSALLSRAMWTRQVVLWGHGEPWVVAHTLVPVSSLRGSLRRLTVLGDTPLGAFLFNQRKVRRGSMEIARPRDGIPGRRSLFHVEQRPLLVAEFFLPALEVRIHHHAQK